MGMDIDSNHVDETEAEVEMDSLPVHPCQLRPHLCGSMNSKVSGTHMCHLPCLQYSHSCRCCCQYWPRNDQLLHLHHGGQDFLCYEPPPKLMPLTSSCSSLWEGFLAHAVCQSADGQVGPWAWGGCCEEAAVASPEWSGKVSVMVATACVCVSVCQCWQVLVLQYLQLVAGFP